MTNLICLFVEGNVADESIYLIWHATCWCIWKIRNNIAFRERLFDGAKLVWKLWVTSSLWSLLLFISHLTLPSKKTKMERVGDEKNKTRVLGFVTKLNERESHRG